MTTIIEGDLRPVLVTSASSLGARSGGILRALASGALVVVDDLRVGARSALLVPPQDLDAVLAFLGTDPATLPLPGEVQDVVR